MEQLKKDLIKVKNKLRNVLKKVYNIALKENINKENKIFVIITFVLYISIICVASFYHEGWQDESQAWLIARDLSPLQIINQMKYEGHSCLWHFMLLPFAKLGLPFDAIKIISIVAAAITGYLVLTKSPFNRLTKLCVLFSSTFLYYMPVIVRPYSLMPLLITIISIMNKDKGKYPILYGVALAIIANTHILMLPFAGMLFLYNYGYRFLYERKQWNNEEKKKIYVGIIIAVIGMSIILGFAVLGYFCSKVEDVDNGGIIENIDILAKKFIYYIMGVEYMQSVLIVMIIGIVCIGLHSIFVSNKHGLIFWMSFLSFGIVYIFVWNSLLNQRAAMIFLFIYYYAWNYRYDIDKRNIKEKFNNIYFILTKLVTICLVMMCIFSIKNTYRVIKTEIQKTYCSGKDMAAYIKENISENSVFLSEMPFYLSTVIAYLDDYDAEFYETLAQRNYTFKTWDKEIYDNDIIAYDNAIKKYEGREIYIIESIEFELQLEEFLQHNPGIEHNAELIYKTGEGTNSGIFYLWKVNTK